MTTTDSQNPVSPPKRKRRPGAPTAATRITTAGVALSVTLGVGAAVVTRASNAVQEDGPETQSAQEVSAVSQLRAERLRHRRDLLRTRRQYQAIINQLAQSYQTELDSATVYVVDDEGSYGSDSSGSDGSGYSTGSSGSSGSSSGSSGGSSGSSGGSTGSAPQPAPAPPVSSGS